MDEKNEIVELLQVYDSWIEQIIKHCIIHYTIGNHHKTIEYGVNEKVNLNEMFYR